VGEGETALESGEVLGQRIGEAQDHLMHSYTQLPSSVISKANTEVSVASKYYRNTT